MIPVYTDRDMQQHALQFIKWTKLHGYNFIAGMNVWRNSSYVFIEEKEVYNQFLKSTKNK